MQNIFILAYYAIERRKRKLVLLGTAFPVCGKYIMTVYHNIVDEDSKTKPKARLSDSFVIGKTIEKLNGEHVMQSPIEVSFEWGNEDEDFVFLKIVDAMNFVNDYLPICPEETLPNPLINEREELKTYHAPIGQYLNNQYPSLNIWSDDYKRVYQYHSNGKRIIVDGGLYRGSCGGPYVNHEGLVVAMHVASMHEGKNISNVKRRKLAKRIDDLESLTSSNYDLHQSVREGVVLARNPDAISFINTQNSSAV
jgi:hypothetical protein